MTYLTTNKLPLVFASVIISLVLLGFIPITDTNSATIFSNEEKPEPDVVVGMTNTMKFTPDTVKINVGEPVKWENTSLLAHSVTADPAKLTIEESVQLPDGAASFDSGMMDPEQTFQHTFKTSGTYQYFCIPHEGAKMYGWIIVKAEK
jgi:plastocyanin